MMPTFTITLTALEAKVASCWMHDIQAWAQHAVQDRIRRLTNDTLAGKLADENPAWTLENMLEPSQREAVREAVQDDMTLVLGGRALSSTHPAAGLVLAALVLPTRAERDVHQAAQRQARRVRTNATPP